MVSTEKKRRWRQKLEKKLISIFVYKISAVIEKFKKCRNEK